MTVTAALNVADSSDPDGSRPLDVDDFKTAATGAATEATQEDVLEQITAAATSLAAVNGKLPALVGGRMPVDTELDISTLGTEATTAQVRDNVATATARLEAIRDRLPAGGVATEASIQALVDRVGATSGDSLLSLLRDIEANTGQAAVDVAQLELTADQVQLNTDAVEAKLDTGNGNLAAILAKIIAAPATEAKQDAIIAALAAGLGVTGPLTDAQLAARLPLSVESRTAVQTGFTYGTYAGQTLVTGWTEAGYTYTVTRNADGTIASITRA